MKKSKPSLSKRSSYLQKSEIRVMSVECEKVKGINLSQGVCDLKTPGSVLSGAKQAIDAGINSYTRHDGLYELRQAIAVKMAKFNHIKADPEKNIIVSSGATGALYCAFLALLNPGDEVIIFEPYYGYHLSTIQAVDLVPRYVRMDPPDWKINIERLEKSITKKTRAILINTPMNPSGKVFTIDELKILADFAIKHDLFIFTDEIYEYFVYGNNKHISPGSLKGIADRTITISGYSKTFSITGWRIGYAVANDKWAKMIGYMNDLVYVCAPAPLQIGVAHGIMRLPNKFYGNLCSQYKNKKDKICQALDSIGLTPFVPQGAYYVLADVKKVPGKTSKEKAMYILKKTGVATVPGMAFYHDKSGENLIRLCFAKDDKILDKAILRLKKLIRLRGIA